MGDEVLDLGRVLGRREDAHFVVLSRNRKCSLPFEVEVVLAADAHHAFEPVRCGGDGGRRLAAPEIVGGQHLRAGGQTLVHRDQGSNRLDLDAGAARGAASRLASLGDDREDHLSVKENFPRGEDRIVAERGAAIVRPRDVRGGQHRQHPGRGTHRVEVHRVDDAARRVGAAGCDVHGAGRLGHVVDVGGGSPDVAPGAVVGKGESDARAFAQVRPVPEFGVGDQRTRLHRRNSTPYDSDACFMTNGFAPETACIPVQPASAGISSLRTRGGDLLARSGLGTARGRVAGLVAADGAGACMRLSHGVTVPGFTRSAGRLDGTHVYETRAFSLRPSRRTVTAGLIHRRQFAGGEAIESVHRTENPGHAAGAAEHGGGIAWRLDF